MAYITISDLRPAGSDLFVDSESFMSELTDDELGLQGGAFWATVAAAVTSLPSIALSVAGAAVGLGIAYLVTH
jgi:Ca2+/Na+ antiporter